MGGAGGHMWHPFDCPDVNSGQDLVDFFRKSIEWAKTNKPALKIDGVNLSFRLRENSNMPTGYEFVIDRGSMKDLDVQGVTADNASKRFVTRDGSVHGMVGATEMLLSIFNSALPDIMDELQQLGMLEDIGPYSRYFNTEFVLKKINVKEYAFDFIALHSVNDFVKKGPRSREGVEAQYDQALLDRIRDKVKPHALKKDFKVFSSITTNLVRDVALEKALNEKFTIVYSSQMRDPEEPGELGIGEGSTKPLKAWLTGVSESPLKKVVLMSDVMIQKYPKMSKKQFAMAKNIYIEALKGTAVNEIVESSEDVEAIVDAVTVWHATRVLGNAVLDSLESEEFGPANEQEGVVIKDNNICGGTRFKFTGDFIVGGLATTFREQKFKTGRLLEGFAMEPINLGEQDKKRYVIMLPGGFKPPTGGHYNMIKHYDKKPDVLKVFVITGPKAREGITLQQSMKIFNIYGGFSDKVEFVTSPDKTPLRTCYEYMKNQKFVSQFPDAYFSIGAGDKGGDPARIQEFVNYFVKNKQLTNAKIAAYAPAPACEVDACPASASRMRKAYNEKDWETFKKLLPHESFYDDVVQVLMRGGTLEENFFTMGSLFSLVDEVLLEEKTRVSAGGQERVSKKIAQMHRAGECDENPKQCAAIAYSKEERRELEESLIEEGDEEIRSAINATLLQFMINSQLPEIKTGLSNEDKNEIIKQFTDDLLTAINRSQTSPEEKSKEIDPMGRGAGGSVQVETSAGSTGGAGGFAGPWVNLEAEKKKKQKARM